MSERDHPEDFPWNDAPAGDALPAEEPEPAEVVGDDGEESDTASPRVPDPYEKYQQESLDARLAEEEPDRGAGAEPASEAEGLVDPDEGGGDVYRADDAETEDVDEPSAEEAAIHIRDEDKI
jgi:hypothetical protein